MEAAGTWSALIHVEGEVDMGSVGGIEIATRREAEKGAIAVIIDLSDCPFIDSSGIAVILRLQDELATRDIPMRLVLPATDPVRRRLIALAGLDRALAILESEVDAVESLSGQGVPTLSVRRRELRL